MRGKILDAILRRLTGHSTEAMTELYSHFRLEDFKPVVAIEEETGIQVCPFFDFNASQQCDPSRASSCCPHFVMSHTKKSQCVLPYRGNRT
jgi:hypothetical protein